MDILNPNLLNRAGQGVCIRRGFFDQPTASEHVLRAVPKNWALHRGRGEPACRAVQLKRVLDQVLATTSAALLLADDGPSAQPRNRR